MKRIIICCDGTWNHPDDEDNHHPASTNVFKMARLISPRDEQGIQGIDQVVYYHDGVGSGNVFDKMLGGAFGVGLSKNIEDAYRFLVNNYVDGDELYFFGFSRGAYTARSLIGLIRNSGLLKKKHADKFLMAESLYKERSNDTNPDSNIAKAFKDQFCHQPTIKFLGVWDTVGSLGIPNFHLPKQLGNLWNFHDVQLSSIVQNAYHAVALDEKRGDFKPCLWTADDNQKQEQVWFSGVHSDVGGGYYQSGLSDIALKWMMNKASSCGLVLDADNISLNDDYKDVLHDSCTGFFLVRSVYKRPIQPNKIHRSVDDRMNCISDYRPIADTSQVNFVD